PTTSIEPLQLPIVGIPVDRDTACVHRHRSRFAELIERIDARLASYTTVLESTPWRSGVQAMVIVDPEDAEDALGRHPVGPRHILRPHRCGESDLRIAGNAQRTRLVLERHDHC